MASAENLLGYIIEKNNKMVYNRDFFKHNIFPFLTKAELRAKFENGFKGVLGSTTRLSHGYHPTYNPDESPISRESLQLDFATELIDEGISERFTSIDIIDSINHPYFINYIPSSGNADKRGELEIGKLLVKLFDLKNSSNWKKVIRDNTPTNLLEKVLLDSLKELSLDKSDNNYTLLNENNYDVAKEDLNYLSNNKDFFMKNIDLFFSFYYFQYIIQTSLYISNHDNSRQDFSKLYFTLASEKITSTRKTVRQGFNLVTNLRKSLLVDETVIAYVNFMIDSDVSYSIQQILTMENSRHETINKELIILLNEYQILKEKRIKDSNMIDNNSIKQNIKLLQEWLSEDMSTETTSRFFRSVDEIGNLYFLKSRGRFGKVLTLDTDMIILLSILIVKDEKMVLTDVFDGFEKRGVWFDRYTKEEVVKLYEKLNILDKQSDSGEAKYVKPIL